MTRALRYMTAIGSLMVLAGCGGGSSPAATTIPSPVATAIPSPSPSATLGTVSSVACALLSKADAVALTGDAAMRNTTNTKVQCTFSHDENLVTLQLQPLSGTMITALQSAVSADMCSTKAVPITVLPDGAFEIIDTGCDALAFATGNLICNIEAATKIPAAAANLEVGVETLADQAHSGLVGA